MITRVFRRKVHRCGPEIEPVYGCTNALATNYDDTATVDNGTCVYPAAGTPIDSECVGFDLVQNRQDGLGGSYQTVEEVNSPECGFVALIPGCTDPLAINYDPLATEDDGSCKTDINDDDDIFYTGLPGTEDEISGLFTDVALTANAAYYPAGEDVTEELVVVFYGTG